MFLLSKSDFHNLLKRSFLNRISFLFRFGLPTRIIAWLSPLILVLAFRLRNECMNYNVDEL